MLLPVQFIILVIDDPHDPADHFLSPVSQEHDHRAVFKGFVLFRIEIFPLVGIQGWNPVFMPFVDLSGKMNKSPHVLPGTDRFNGNTHTSQL
jgi:hypothetical protein